MSDFLTSTGLTYNVNISNKPIIIKFNDGEEISLNGDQLDALIKAINSQKNFKIVNDKNNDEDEIPITLKNADKLKIDNVSSGSSFRIQQYKSNNERLMDIAQQLYCYYDFQNNMQNKSETTVAQDAIRRAEILYTLFKERGWL